MIFIFKDLYQCHLLNKIMTNAPQRIKRLSNKDYFSCHYLIFVWHDCRGAAPISSPPLYLSWILYQNDPPQVVLFLGPINWTAVDLTLFSLSALGT